MSVFRRGGNFFAEKSVAYFSEIRYIEYMSNSALQKAYELLRRETPLYTDCGKLCGRACCKGDGRTGMNLLPGEPELLAGKGFDILPPEGNHGCPVLVCGGRCDRAFRPFACRIFPLYPLVTLDGSGSPRVGVVYDPRSESLCPLAADKAILNRNFVTAVRRAAKYLLRDEKIRAYLLSASADILEIEELKRKLFK